MAEVTGVAPVGARSGLLVRGVFLGHEERDYRNGNGEPVTASTVVVLAGMETVKLEFRTPQAALAYFGGKWPGDRQELEVPVEASAFADHKPVRISFRVKG